MLFLGTSRHPADEKVARFRTNSSEESLPCDATDRSRHHSECAGDACMADFYAWSLRSISTSVTFFCRSSIRFLAAAPHKRQRSRKPPWRSGEFPGYSDNVPKASTRRRHERYAKE